MKQKTIVLLGVILAMICLFSGCAKDDEVPAGSDTQATDTQAPTPTPETPPEETVKEPVEVGKYVMITPDRMSKFETETSNSLYSKIQNKTGEEWEYEEGSYAQEDETKERYELLVGNTGRPETAAALAKLDYNQYGIFVSEYKIVVVGWTEYTTRLAVETMSSMLGECTVKRDDGKYVFKFASNEIIKTYDEYLGGLPALTGAAAPKEAFDCSDKCFAIWYEKVDATSFDTYSAIVKAAGFTAVNENKLGNNSYATYVKEGAKIHFYYVSSEKELRVVYGPNDVDADLMQTAAVPAKVTPSVTLMPMRYISAEGGGTCMVYLLEDGTFFVIDGGWKEEAEVLYKTLVALNTDANGADAPIVISAWFISHAHGDHTGNIYEFAKTYGDKVKVNALICNDAHVTQTSDAKATTAGTLNAGKLKSGVLRYFTDTDGKQTKIMKLHTGQKLSFGGMKIDVLFTHEDMFDVKVTNFNNFNTILRIELGGHTLFMGNDAVKQELPKLIEEVDASVLKAEFCMVMHHGADSGYKRIYEVVDADYYFWPNSKPHYDRDILQNKYDYCLYVVNDAVEIYLADTYCTTLELPYEAGQALKWLPDSERPSDKKSEFIVSTTPEYGPTVGWADGQKKESSEEE